MKTVFPLKCQDLLVQSPVMYQVKLNRVGYWIFELSVCEYARTYCALVIVFFCASNNTRISFLFFLFLGNSFSFLRRK